MFYKRDFPIVSLHRDYIDKIKGKPTVGNQKAQKHKEYGRAQWEGQAPKHTNGKQLPSSSSKTCNASSAYVSSESALTHAQGDSSPGE
jgi:hypothetical protein